LPALPFVAWPLYCLSRGEYRWELAVLVLLGAGLPYIGPRSKRLYLGIFPLGLVAVLYDAMRFVSNVGLRPGRIHVCDLRSLEMRWFGISVNGRTTTVHDFLQAHATLPLDLAFAIPYGTFLGAAVFFAVFLYFRDDLAMRRFTTAFFVLNMAGFITYHLYPAAPPWYFHAHGCNVDLATRASEGPNLARVDTWLGFRYFGGFYGRSKSVFGAVPSLHVAYPLLIALEGWSAFALRGNARPLKWPLRTVGVLFYLWMCTAAVYLDHHWIFDVLVGSTYALAVFVALRTLPLLAPREPIGTDPRSIETA
jgi:inositol phosphorylceramide synthase catalytic subunit